MVDDKSIELRLTLTQKDPLYQSFSRIKRSLGIKSNSEVARFIIKQISKIPISNLILNFMGEMGKVGEVPDSIKKEEPIKKK